MRRIRSLWNRLARTAQLDAAMHDEMRFHIEMEAERLMREYGLAPEEARRQAHVRFGGIEKYKEAGRDVRGRQWLDAISLDTRFGVRMLVKYRGLTLIGAFAMAMAIAIGATSFEVLGEMLTPELPLEDGDRVVSVQYATANPGSPERQLLHDFAVWRDRLKSIEQLGAFRTIQHNLVSAYAPPEPIKVAEMTASGFAVARTPPLMGRYLLPADEREGAAPVVVISHQAWQSRFAGDPQIIGRTVNLGGVARTVAGVMPEGFHFPYNHHFWIVFRANPLAYQRFQGPSIYIFGRLAPGVTIAEAEAELSAMQQPDSAALAETRERLQPRVHPYTRDHVDITQPTMVMLLRIAQLLTGALSFVVAVNLAILFYARTVTRLGEIAVRTALGASRRRILAQLFVEALALSLVGAGVGLMLSDFALGYAQSIGHANGGVPFWIRFELSGGTVIFALALAAVAAVIMGVLPGLKATGPRVYANLHALNGRTGTRLGPLWTTLVVAQVAVAVAILPAAVYMTWRVVRMEVAGPGFAAEKFVVATLAVDGETGAAATNRIIRRQLEVMSRLEAEPGVGAVTFSSNVPGFAGSGHIQFEDNSGREVSALDVSIELFDVYGVEILAGRPFTAGDLGKANAVIVNQTFVRTALAGGSHLGRRFRYLRPQTPQSTTAAEEWYQIVGVVRDFPSFPPDVTADGEPTVYHPAAVGALHPVTLSIRFSGNMPAGYVDRIRAIGADIDPALQLRRVVPLSNFYNDVRSFWRYLAWGIGLVTTSVLLLSAAGIYALMSFTVAQRTREIGIRTALGAQPRRVLLNVFARAMRQLAVGVLVGSLLSAAAFFGLGLGLALATPLLFSVAAIMLMVGVLAAVGPARRGLRIQASEALRADA